MFYVILNNAQKHTQSIKLLALVCQQCVEFLQLLLYLFGAELFRCREVFPIVVTEMIVAHNRHRLKTEIITYYY